MKRPERPIQEFVLKCPNNPEIEPVMALRRLGTMEIQAAYQQGTQYYFKHFTGVGPYKDGKLDVSSPNYVPPVPLPAVDGQGVILTLDTCQTLAVVEAAQTAVGDERYRFDELAAFATSDTMANYLLEAANWVQPDLSIPGDENPLA
jgi:hypothetical protein